MDKTEMPDAMKPEPKPEPKPATKSPDPPGLASLKTALKFDLKKYLVMGKDFLKDAAETGKEHASAIVAYQQQMTELFLQAQGGKIKADVAREGMRRFERAITLRLAAARQTMDWQRAKLYFKASRELLDFVMGAAGALIAAL